MLEIPQMVISEENGTPAPLELPMINTIIQNNNNSSKNNSNNDNNHSNEKGDYLPWNICE